MDEQPDPGANVGRRGHSRLHVRLPACITTRSRTMRGILRDISLTGAGLELPAQPRLGEDALIEWGSFEAFGKFVQIGRHTCGLEFDECVLPAVLLATRDLDDVERLPRDVDLVRRLASDWASGVTRL